MAVNVTHISLLLENCKNKQTKIQEKLTSFEMVVDFCRFQNMYLADITIFTSGKVCLNVNSI